MPTVAELTDPYVNFLLSPVSGAGTCEVCLTFTQGYARCYVCSGTEQLLATVVPISYSVAGGQLHQTLRGYKRFGGDVARRLQTDVAALLWRFLADHERCVARGAGVAAFELVTTVPSGSLLRDEHHPLRHLVSNVVLPTKDRFRRLLTRTDRPIADHTFSSEKFVATRALAGESVLLIDDTWTTGASIQAAAAALRTAGAGRIGSVVIGRHINPDFQDNQARLRGLTGPFDWSICARH